MLRRLITKFKEHPIIRNSVQISLIYAAGDLTQQTFISKVEKYDYTNTRNVAVVGGENSETVVMHTGQYVIIVIIFVLVSFLY